ncbi:MAG: hypothetical protein Q9168_003622 [Polycauliona sp. 1 TL-2023]
MEKLSTFSITVDAESGEALKHGFWFHLRHLDVLLKALPASLIHLELDLAFRDIPGDGGPMHLCPTIRLLLPHLKDLRLRLRTVCEALFASPTDAPLRASNLDSLTMNTNEYRTRASTCIPMDEFNFKKLVEYPQTLVPDGITTTAPRMEVMGPSETESYWTSTCSKALQAGCFPVIQHLNVLDFEEERYYEGYEIDEWEEDEYGLDPGAYGAAHWNLHDVLARKTYCFPVMRVGADPRDTMLRTEGHIEEFGDHHAIEQRVEGPAWVETVGGARFPASFAATELAISQNYVWRDLELISRQELQKRSKFGLEIWDAEEETNGQWLVDVEELDHF